MFWRVLLAAVLGTLVALFLWDRERVLDLLPERLTPHERYVRGLEAAGLAETALARDWTAEAARALEAPQKSALPLKAAVEHAAGQPRAYGYAFELERGRVLNVEVTLDGPEPARVFLDLFRVTEESREYVTSADEGVLRLGHEVRRDGTYILRVQPELLRGGTLRITNTTTAALTFPVAGHETKHVNSFFLDPRDAGRRDHHGIDIFAPGDTPVLAASDGHVVSVGTNRLGGNVVWIWDPARRQSQYYAHLSRQAVTRGQRVDAGDVVGFVGNTGNARGTAPHLHFGIYASDGPIDPLPFVRGARGPQPPSEALGAPSSGEKPEQTRTGVGG